MYILNLKCHTVKLRNTAVTDTTCYRALQSATDSAGDSTNIPWSMSRLYVATAATYRFVEPPLLRGFLRFPDGATCIALVSVECLHDHRERIAHAHSDSALHAVSMATHRLRPSQTTSPVGSVL